MKRLIFIQLLSLTFLVFSHFQSLGRLQKMERATDKLRQENAMLERDIQRHAYEFAALQDVAELKILVHEHTLMIPESGGQMLSQAEFIARFAPGTKQGITAQTP